jgi:hypothetical protein
VKLFVERLVNDERPASSVSKLRTFRDGWRTLSLIAKLIKDERPLQFFGAAGATLILVAIVMGLPLAAEYLETGLVPRFPTAILCSAMVITGTLSIFCRADHGYNHDGSRLFYLSAPPRPPARWDR